MIEFPVKYSEEAECVEDAKFFTVCIPYISSGQTQEDKHELGRALAEMINTGTSKEAHPMMTATKEGINGDLVLPESVKAQLNTIEKNRYNRSMRKLRKYVERYGVKYGA